jgi:glycosyltransferase involved in cell wall biosynthesis
VKNVAVVRVSLDEPLRELEVDAGCTEALAIVLSEGEVLGELLLPASNGAVALAELRTAVDAQLGERFWRQRLEHAFTRATRDGQLSDLPAPSDVIAFVGDGCAPDEHWLDDLGRPFSDPLVMAVAGYVEPIEAGATAVFERTVYDGLVTTHAELREGNLLVRRSALERFGPHDDGFVDRVLHAGYRVVFEPHRIVWRGSQADSARPVQVPTGSESPPAPARVERAAAPDLTVTIASYNRRERLADVLRALAEQTFPAERFELVLVVDGSTDGSAEMARALDMPYAMRVLEQENRGLSACRNRGGREARHPIVVWLDDDIVPDPGFLAAHAAAHADAPERRIVLGHSPPAVAATDLLTMMVRGVWHDYFRRRSEPDHRWSYIDFGDGNMSAAPALLAAAGDWDEDFAQQTVRRQDWELAIRLIQRGVRFEDCPAASGQHFFDTRLASVLRNRRIEGHSDVVLGRKHPSARGHLFLARLARTSTAGGRRSRLFQLAYRSNGLSAALMRGGLSLLGPLEARDSRSKWWSLLGQLLSLAYMAGVREALPSLDAFREFVEPVLSRQHAARLNVALDERGVLELPPVVTPVTLSLQCGPTAIGEVEALEPETQWDWDRLSERVATEAWRPFRAAVDQA